MPHDERRPQVVARGSASTLVANHNVRMATVVDGDLPDVAVHAEQTNTTATVDTARTIATSESSRILRLNSHSTVAIRPVLFCVDLRRSSISLRLGSPCATCRTHPGGERDDREHHGDEDAEPRTVMLTSIEGPPDADPLENPILLGVHASMVLRAWSSKPTAWRTPCST